MNLSGSIVKATKSSQFVLSKHAPTLLVTGGVVGFAATVALAIRGTAKAVDILPEISADVNATKVKKTSEHFTEKAKTEELIRVYLKHSLKLAHIYGPTLVVGGASIICVLSAHGMMLKRQAGLVAAYTALDASYKAYRRRVADEIGEEKELGLYHRVKTTTIEGEEGQPCEIIDMGDTMPSPYARFFDEYNRNWTKTAEYNNLFLRAQQQSANDRLNAYGYVFLNEVYESLGLERSQAGQMVGWKKGNGGDDFIDFGIYDIFDESSRAFVNGFEPTVLLDFNVDGIIKI